MAIAGRDGEDDVNVDLDGKCDVQLLPRSFVSERLREKAPEAGAHAQWNPLCRLPLTPVARLYTQSLIKTNSLLPLPFPLFNLTSIKPSLR